MTSSQILKFLIGVSVVSLFFVIVTPHVFAVGESVVVQNVSPLGAINPGTSVSFVAAASGFVDPVYAVSDSFSASGATTGAIDKVGFFTWTPGIYDAGKHTLTISVTDASDHSATTTVNLYVASTIILVTGLSPGPIVAIHRPVTFTVVAPGFTTPNYALYDSNYSSSVNGSDINSSGVFSWTPTIDDLGTHTLTIVASDSYGHTAQTLQNLTVINPTISVQSFRPGSTAGVGSLVSFFASASFMSTTTYSVSDSFTGTSTVMTSAINTTTGLFTWTPTTADLGLHLFTVTATDAYGNAASTTATILITNVPARVPTSTNNSPVTPITASSSPIANTQTKYLFTRNLMIGSQGTAVLELQKRLTALALYTGPVSGYFGPLTSAGVKKFQSVHGIMPVGTVGPITRVALNK